MNLPVSISSPSVLFHIYVYQISKMIVDLKETCLNPETKEPYILESKGGINNSPEGSNVSQSEPLSKLGLRIFR